MTSGTQDKKTAKLTVPIDFDRDHYRGNPDAPIQLVEYGDFECPYCYSANFIIQDLQERIGSDQICYIFRHFPLTKVHPHAQLAAEASEAAGVQGKYWEMHEILFENQNHLNRELIIDLADQIGLDVEQFEKDLKNNVCAERVRENFVSGVRSGVNGTPTLFVNGTRYDGAWDLESLLEIIEKPLGVRIRLITQEFAEFAAAGGIMLLIFTLIALVWSNLFADDYFHLFESTLTFSLGDFSVGEHLLEWINDGLMAVFFFVVGLEIKREVTVGELATRKKAALPIFAALGGMIFPALFYLIININNPSGYVGFGIPIATDIAFTIVILTVLGNRIPFSLKIFFSALAIADDLGAVMVIAIFYTTSISIESLAVAAIIFAGLIFLNRSRVYWALPYALLGIGLWLAFLQSGVHPTIAGVLLAITIPTRSPANTKALLSQCVTLLDEFESSPERADSRREGMIDTLETITDRMQSPAQRLERDLQPWTTFLGLPVFALANTGVTLDISALSNLFHPIAIGIIFGLVIGKPLGITLFAWLAIRLKIADMPKDVNWSQLISASFLAGIGFTMSLFIANTAFTNIADSNIAKIGILFASIIAAIIGIVLLDKFRPNYEGVTNIKLPMD